MDAKARTGDGERVRREKEEIIHTFLVAKEKRVTKRVSERE